MDTSAVITIPKDGASFADAEDSGNGSAGGCTAGRQWLLSYKCNDRKIGRSVSDQRISGRSGNKQGRQLRMTEIRHRIRQHQYRRVGKPKQAKSSFHLTLPKLPKLSVRTVLIVVVSVLLAAACCAALVWLFYRCHQEEKRRQEGGENGRQRLRRSAVRREEFEKLLERKADGRVLLGAWHSGGR